jgi:acyl-CoA reductase-like NAD-dependent aldehyde dehydrogenase
MVFSGANLMDLADRHQALRRGALLVAESAEDAYRLGALDRFLKPWVRGRLDSLGGLLDSCDTRRQLAEDVRGLAQTAAEYSHLRKQLFSESLMCA